MIFADLKVDKDMIGIGRWVWANKLTGAGPIEYEIIGEGSQISTNQKPGNSAFSLLIG